MSIEDLKRLGVLVESPVGERDKARSRVSLPWFILTAALAVGGCILMPVGRGEWLTWIGLGLFLVGLMGFIAANMAGIDPED